MTSPAHCPQLPSADLPTASLRCQHLPLRLRAGLDVNRRQLKITNKNPHFHKSPETRDFCVLILLHTHAFIHERNEPYLPLPSQSKLQWSLFTEPGGVEGWVGLSTTAVSKQPAQDWISQLLTV